MAESFYTDSRGSRPLMMRGARGGWRLRNASACARAQAAGGHSVSTRTHEMGRLISLYFVSSKSPTQTQPLLPRE